MVCLEVQQPGVIECVEVDEPRLLQPDLAVAVVALSAELNPVQQPIGNRQQRRVVGADVRVGVPRRRLSVCLVLGGSAHDRLVRERRVAALDADVVRV